MLPGIRRTPLLAPLTLTFAPALLFLSASIAAYLHADVPFEALAREPAMTLGAHPLTGLQSTLGAVVWSAAAAICCFSAAALRGASGAGRLAPFLAWSGLVTAVLAFDDLFQVHEDLAARYLALPELAVLCGYALLLAAHGIAFRDVIRRTESTLLVLALALFGLSLAVDAAADHWRSPWRIFFEDGFKLLGIAGWSGYLIRTCFHALADARLRAPV